MKKAEEYITNHGLYTAYSVMTKEGKFTQVISIENAKEAIKKAQEDAIKEAVKRCAEKATYNRSIFENLNYVSIDRPSILKVADELIKQFNLG